MLHRSRGAILSCALILALVSCSDEPPRLRLEKARLRAKGKTIIAELARKPEEQARGLMYRRSLGGSEGMLFVYNSPVMVSFWMKNTRIPLSIAFMDGSGRIIHIEQMQPYDPVTRHPSPQPFQYALEMNQGWFERNGVGVGDIVEIPNPKSKSREENSRFLGIRDSGSGI